MIKDRRPFFAPPFFSNLLLLSLVQFACQADSDKAVDSSLNEPVETPQVSCMVVDDPNHGDEGTVDIGVTVVAEGLATPWGLGWLPNGDMLISERDGIVSRLSAGVLTQLGQVPSLEKQRVGCWGWLSIRIDTTRSFYLYATASTHGGIVTRVSRGVLSEGLDAMTEADIVLDDMAARQFHNGGRLRIGPDDKLYVGTGDAGEPTTSQVIAHLSGKILRINLDGSIPDDNPFVAYGLNVGFGTRRVLTGATMARCW